MIIRSQDKKMIINFDSASNIYMHGTEIWANTYHGIAKLGTYSTEAKAIKVLDMIEDACRNMPFTDGIVFRMPSDVEVEV